MTSERPTILPTPRSLSWRAVGTLFCVLFCVLCCSLLAACGAAGERDREGRAPEARELGDGFAEVGSVMHAPVEVPEGSPTVLFLGDSLTAGLHLDPSNAFPAALQRLLAADGAPFFLENAGVSGDTSAGGRTRIPVLLESTRPDVVVVELGANDGLRGVKLSSTEANLRSILTTIREAGARPLLLGMNVPTNLGPYADDFALIYGRLAEELDVALVPRFLDGVGGIPELNLRDGMHPTPEGHERLARNMATALRALVVDEGR